MSKTSEIVEAARAAIAQGHAHMERAHDELRPQKEPVPPLPPLAAEEDFLSVDARVANIRESLRCNRRVAAGSGLVGLRQWYEASDPSAFPAGERTWADFTAQRMPWIEPADIQQLIGRALYRGALLQCTSCGARAACRCGCGAPYAVEHPWAAAAPAPAPAPPSALERAAAAILATPEKSNGAIAAEIGVSHQTVGRARRRIEAVGKDGRVMDGSRVGRDGRRYKLPAAEAS
jgi:hypothetical protein